MKGSTFSKLQALERPRSRGPSAARGRADPRSPQSAASPPGLEIYALGALRVVAGERDVTAILERRRRAAILLKFLVTREIGHLVPKDVLLEVLWPNSAPAYSEQCLRFSISVLRHVLEPDLAPRSPSTYLTSREGRCGLRPGAAGFFDVAELLSAMARARQSERSGDAESRARALERAVELYRGDFLEGEPYAEWAVLTRERLREEFLSAALQLGRHRLEAGDLPGATQIGLRAIERDPLSEPLHRLVLTGYARRGEWGRAKTIYDRFQRALADHDLPRLPGLAQLIAS